MAPVPNECPTIDSFHYYLKTFGVSSSSLFDVKVQIPETSDLYKYLKNLGSFTPPNYNPLSSISFYTDECQLPGEQISTGTYQFNSSPVYKYATTVVYPEVTITLLLDSFMNQKKIFERWVDFIKPLSLGTENFQLMRTRYKDDYVADISVVSYSRYIHGTFDQGVVAPKKIPYMKTSSGAVRALAPSPIYRYSTILKNAFPTTISSVQLSSGSMQLNRVSITFNYDYPIYTSTQRTNILPDTTGAIENRRFS